MIRLNYGIQRSENGGTAARAVTGHKEGVTKMRGKWFKWRDIPVMVTYAGGYARKVEDTVTIHANTVAMSENLDEIRRLTEYLHDRCPAIEHHNLAIIRGDRKNPSLQGPQLQQYRELYQHIATVWADREEHRFGASVEPMLQWAKVKTIEAGQQVVPCKAGILSAVVYANGDVSVCETHAPLGNLRRNRFFEIWDSPQAQALRARICANDCYCTNEVFLWPSIVFQPGPLARAFVGAKLERRRATRSDGRSAETPRSFPDSDKP